MNPIQAMKERTREKLLSDFPAFCKRAWREIEPRELQWSWHHELICEYLMLAYEREELRLIFCMPPRELKSRLVSIFFPAWCWAKDPGQSFISVSYSDSLSEEHSTIRRKLLQSRWFQTTFPNRVIFSTDSNRREQYHNSRGGMMVATSTEGTLLGKGSDFVLIDDLLSPQQSFSDSEKTNANRFFDSTVRSRLNEPTRGGIVIVQQRLHQADLIGHLLETEPDVWKLVNMPMIAERDEEIVFPISGRRIFRKAGDLLHPARFPKSWCEKQEKILGRIVWSSQYQQQPSPVEGNIVKAADIQYFGGRDPVSGTPDPQLPEKFERKIISVDSSFKDLKSSDYVCVLTIGITGSRRYVLNIVNSRLSLDGTENEIRNAYAAYGPISAVLVEDKGNGPSVIQHLKDEIPGLIAVNPEGGKLARLVAASPEFSAHNWYFDRTAAWTARAVDQLTSFPACKNDDIADAISQASIWLQSNSFQFGLLDFFKNVAAGKRKVPPTPEERRAAVTRVDNFALQKKANVPCPVCKNTSTVRQGSPGNIHCNQCSIDFNAAGEITQRPVETVIGVNCCEHPLRQVVANEVKCGNCGLQSGRDPREPAPRGVSRKQYLAGLGQYALRVSHNRNPFGRFG